MARDLPPNGIIYVKIKSWLRRKRTRPVKTCRRAVAGAGRTTKPYHMEFDGQGRF